MLMTANFSSSDPLHGVTLEKIVARLAETYGWAELGKRIPVRCFLYDPSVKSSLTFLRKTPWARAKVEALFIELVQQNPDSSQP
ncbi:MAG TPA: VF530 family protein [Opitutaceae bacterium]